MSSLVFAYRIHSCVCQSTLHHDIHRCHGYCITSQASKAEPSTGLALPTPSNQISCLGHPLPLLYLQPASAVPPANTDDTGHHTRCLDLFPIASQVL